jgi:hypothetical protein
MDFVTTQSQLCGGHVHRGDICKRKAKTQMHLRVSRFCLLANQMNRRMLQAGPVSILISEVRVLVEHRLGLSG